MTFWTLLLAMLADLGVGVKLSIGLHIPTKRAGNFLFFTFRLLECSRAFRL